MGKYLRKKLIVYLITFVLAVTINFIIPRLMPGDPIQSLLSRFSGMEGGREILENQLTLLFNLNQPLWQQYLNFWKSVFTLDFGISIIQFPTPVLDIIKRAIVYDLSVLLPAIILSWIVGNKLGAYSGTDKKMDNATMPFFYFLASSPYFWMAGIVAFFFGVKLGWFPISGAYGSTSTPGFRLSFILDFIHHWFLPFFTMFLVQLGGWAIGMRNMIIYERSSNYSKYMSSLGASDGLIRQYGFRNGVLPQVTGLALRIGRIVGGAITVQVVFNYPGLGRMMLDAVQNQDYFLLQGIFLTIVTMVLVANFIVDIIYMFIDPRVRLSFTEEV
ncbi:ABC transporter permease [Halanaerobium salsuginis]|uniref:Peptide/nickel transport system permease protein n=1 Tax=Halanaerobium salsuginis TaxID=29563 RepID=A0A1I4JU92_9FIRM|nr:ABC transporter permease [Halanaerobium salsuginis]SFL69686.1 peptide/nickel transport system permease protein [Halanaerobium salsuginis]